VVKIKIKKHQMNFTIKIEANLRGDYQQQQGLKSKARVKTTT
jgi:hypothetical protein